jgi:hypothetical protein
MLLLAAILCVISTTLSAQLLTQGAAFSVFQQMDNSSILPQNWTHSIGIGHFNTGGLVPRSLLHVNSVFTPLPQNGSIATQGETFRTTVPSASEQHWRMERGTPGVNLLEIGHLYHGGGANTSFNVQASQSSGNLWLRNSAFDGFRLNANGVVAAPLNGYILTRTAYAALGDDQAINGLSGGGGGLTPNGPWARFHLVDPEQGANSPNFAYRPWMINGLMASGYSDLCYFGQLYVEVGGIPVDDATNTIIAWGESDLPDGLVHSDDNFQFRYVSSLGNGGQAGTDDGLELMRLRPFRATFGGDIEGFVGIGDWNGTALNPEERLDVLDRTIRLRDFSISATTSYLNQAASVDRVLVADENDGTVYWRPMSDFAGQTDCDWHESTGNQRITTAWTGAGSCNTADWQVGIGTNVPISGTKLEVLQHDMATNNRGLRVVTDGGSNNNFGIQAECRGNGATQNYGISLEVEDGNSRNYGLQTQAFIRNGTTAADNRGINALAQVSGSGSSSTNNYGVFSWSYVAGSGASVNNNYGGYFRSNKNATGTIIANSYGVYASAAGATGTVTGTSAANYGVYGLATSSTPGENVGAYGRAQNATMGNWGGYFVGDGFLSATMWTYSDAALKVKMNDVTSATAKLLQLNPKTYEMDWASYPDLGLTDRPQIGLIAQDLEAVFPELVRDVVPLAIPDSVGNLVPSTASYKAVNYDGLIPVLIAAIKEQQAQIDQMQSQIDDCCKAGSINHRQHENSGSGGINGFDTYPTDLKISPNPFSTSTTLQFDLAEESEARVVATDQQGKQIATLFQSRTSGPQQVVWDTSPLPAGMYYVSLYVANELSVKKAVKMVH